jgi:23S rRNA (cytosine1962-C5)-methyltransferase
MARIETSTLKLPDFIESELAAGHPWVYRNHIPAQFEAATGSWVCAKAGRTKVWALWDNESQIALRVFTRNGPPSPELFFERVQSAYELRQALTPTPTAAYRLINGEGDGLPSIVVDIYGEYAVVATYCAASRVLLPQLVDAIIRSVAPRGIIHKQATREPAEQAEIELLFGQPPPDDLVVSEGDVRYYADLARGHKTGLYLDQRDNRRTFAKFTRAGSVLNLFSYTGGFSLVAARAGAARTSNVDISQHALTRARDNFILNELDPSVHQFTATDCYDYLKAAVRSREIFDSVVCDPPSLARNRAQLDHALKAYLHINALGLQLVRAGGYYAAASCTAQVSPEQFRQILSEAAQRAGRSAQIVHDAGHAIDHPIGIGHPEGRYLKFIVLRLLNEPQ